MSADKQFSVDDEQGLLERSAYEATKASKIATRGAHNALKAAAEKLTVASKCVAAKDQRIAELVGLLREVGFLDFPDADPMLHANGDAVGWIARRDALLPRSESKSVQRRVADQRPDMGHEIRQMGSAKTVVVKEECADPTGTPEGFLTCRARSEDRGEWCPRCVSHQRQEEGGAS